MDMQRILIIDDNTAIHEDFRKILDAQNNTDSNFEEIKIALFGGATTVHVGKKFRIDFAYQGKDGFDMIKNAIDQNDPYAMAFIDVLMPPGWNGIETVKHIWEVDPHVQIVLCAASSGCSWEDIMKSIGQSDKLLLLRKPFDSMEASQLAYSLTEKWRLSKEVREEIELLKEFLKITVEFINDAVFLPEEKFNI